MACKKPDSPLGEGALDISEGVPVDAGSLGPVEPANTNTDTQLPDGIDVSQIVCSSLFMERGNREADIKLFEEVEALLAKNPHCLSIDQLLSKMKNPEDLEVLLPEIKRVMSDARLVIAALLGAQIAFERLEKEVIRMKEVMQTDELTGLWNDSSFQRHSASILKNREEMPCFSFVFADIDNFKAINTNFGHPGGDFVLKTVGQIILNNIRSLDIGARCDFFRAGGEEFAFFLYGTDGENACGFAERLRKIIANHQFEYNQPGEGTVSIPVTMSFGVTQCFDTDTDFKFVRARGGKAMQASKDGGRNQTHHHNGRCLEVIAVKEEEGAQIVSKGVSLDGPTPRLMLEVSSPGNDPFVLPQAAGEE